MPRRGSSCTLWVPGRGEAGCSLRVTRTPSECVGQKPSAADWTSRGKMSAASRGLSAFPLLSLGDWHPAWKVTEGIQASERKLRHGIWGLGSGFNSSSPWTGDSVTLTDMKVQDI